MIPTQEYIAINLKQLIETGLDTDLLNAEVFVVNINSRTEDNEAVADGTALPVTQLTPDDQGNLLIQYAGPLQDEDDL